MSTRSFLYLHGPAYGNEALLTAHAAVASSRAIEALDKAGSRRFHDFLRSRGFDREAASDEVYPSSSPPALRPSSCRPAACLLPETLYEKQQPSKLDATSSLSSIVVSRDTTSVAKLDVATVVLRKFCSVLSGPGDFGKTPLVNLTAEVFGIEVSSINA